MFHVDKGIEIRNRPAILPAIVFTGDDITWVLESLKAYSRFEVMTHED